MYYAINIDQNGEIINPDLSSVEGWVSKNDVETELVSMGYAQEENGTFMSRNEERVKIIEK